MGVAVRLTVGTNQPWPFFISLASCNPWSSVKKYSPPLKVALRGSMINKDGVGGDKGRIR